MIELLALGVAVSIATTPVAPVEVDWNKGWGPAEKRKGLPDPPGWYRAAVGPHSTEKVLYLTFDDGPSGNTPRLLKALSKADARATFFVAGGYAASNPRVITRMLAQGHAVGNHTWNHPRLTDVSTARVRAELLSTKRAIGPKAAPCMRPPYGLINDKVATTAIKAGLQPILWTAHIEDWSPHSMQWTMRRLQKATKPGSVILMHDTHAQTVSAVAAMLPRWAKQGYRFEPVPACS